MIETPVGPRAIPAAPGYGDVRFLDVPEKRFFMIDGHGQPGSDPAFQAAIQTLYPAAYTLKFALKGARGVGPKVGALEGLFVIDGAQAGLDAARLPEVDASSRAHDWTWRLMMPIPDEATDREVAAAIEEVRRRKAPPAIDLLRVETFDEGLSAEITHVGPYSAELPTIERLHAAIAAAGCRPRGLHHEIYVGDPNRSSPEKLRTIIRQPIE